MSLTDPYTKQIPIYFDPARVCCIFHVSRSLASSVNIFQYFTKNKLELLPHAHRDSSNRLFQVAEMCVLLLQDLLQSCSRGGEGEWRTCAMRDDCDEPRSVWTSLPITVTVTQKFTVPGKCVCVCFITAGHITKLFAWGGEESGGHVL